MFPKKTEAEHLKIKDSKIFPTLIHLALENIQFVLMLQVLYSCLKRSVSVHAQFFFNPTLIILLFSIMP